jgi:hypothetical protein
MASAGAHSDRTASPWRGFGPTFAFYLTVVGAAEYGRRVTGPGGRSPGRVSEGNRVVSLFAGEHDPAE